jgi:phospholipid/cholesterol/gamma-HCH transport system substrate-binding protein
MQKQAPTLGRLLVMVGFALSCFGLLLFLWLAFGGPIPLQPKGWQFKAKFPEASQLADEADVRISGVPVGKVKTIAASGGTSLVTMQIDPKFAPIKSDAKAILRQKSLLGETYVELTPGNPGAKPLREGGTLAPGQVAPTVQLDEIFRAFTPKTRAAFQNWIQTLAEALSGRGTDLNNAIGNLPAFEQDANTLLKILNTQQGAVQRLVSNTGVVFDALSERDGQLSSLITNGNRVFSTTAQRNRELADTFVVLPTFEQQSQLTLERLDRFAHNANPLVSELRPAAHELSPTLQQLELLAPDLEHLFRDVEPLVAASRRGLPALDRFVDDLRPLLGQFDPFLRQVNPVLFGVGQYKKELNAFFANSAAATQATETPPGGAPVHYLRTTNPLNPEALAQYPRRIGSNRPNPYQFPDAFAGLANGLPVYENRQCGRSDPTVATPGGVAPTRAPGDVTGAPPTPELPTLPSVPTDPIPSSLLSGIEQFVFGGSFSEVPAPPCNLQSKYPPLGDTSRASTQYPQLHPEPPADR